MPRLSTILVGLCILLLILSAFALYILHHGCLVHTYLRLLCILGWLIYHYALFLSTPGVCFFALIPTLYNIASSAFLITVYVVYLFLFFYFQPTYTITENIVYCIYHYIYSFHVLPSFTVLQKSVPYYFPFV